MKQVNAWFVQLKDEYPKTDGWYLVRADGKTYAMYFRTVKRSYSDSQWYLSNTTNICWKGLLPKEWLKVEDIIV